MNEMYYNIRKPDGTMMLGHSVKTYEEALNRLRSYTRKYGFDHDKPYPNGKGVYPGTKDWRIVRTSRRTTL